MQTIAAILVILSSFITNNFNKYILHIPPQASLSGTGLYSVTINNTPTLNNNGDFVFNASIKNISVKPFVSKLYFNNCTFSNETVGTRKASGDEKDLEKALLPGENASFDFHFIEMWNHCIYDDKGTQICRDAKDFRLQNCQVTISNSSGNPINLPISVDFP